MDTQIQRSNSSSGGVHVCRKCGWPFPKPHPSSRHRRAHKKVCGSIEGYARVDYGDEVASDDDSRGETLTDGSKSVEKSARRGGSEEELFTDAVTEFADVNVAIADAGNLFPPSSANGAQVLTPEREGAGIDTPLQQNLSSSSVDSVPSTGSDPKEGENLDCRSEEVADEKRFGLDGKTDSSEKSFRATGDTSEEAGRRLETFTSCNDRFYNMVETDHLLLREHSAVILESCEDQRTEIGETVDNSEAILEGVKLSKELSAEKKGEEAQQNVILADATARNFLDDIDSLAESMKGGEYVEYDHKDAQIYDALAPEADVTNLAKEELALASENFSADDNEVRSGEVERLSESSLIGQAGEERKFEHELPVALLESKSAINVENNDQKSLQESEAASNEISGTDDHVDSTQSLAITEERDLDQGEQEETDVGSNGETCLTEEKGLNFGFVDGDMNLVKENLSESALIDQVEAERKLEDELPVASLESKDTIPVEDNVQKSLQEPEAGDNAISGTAGNVDSTQSLTITKEGDLDRGKQEETVAGSNSETHSVEENEGMISGLTDGDVNLMKEEKTVSTFEGIISSNGDRNLAKPGEMATVSALDVQADTCSQTNSLEGNWGSASAHLSTNAIDAPDATETESLPPQAPATVQTPILLPGSDDDKQETSLLKPNEDESGRNQGPTGAQTPQIPPGSKKNEEIGAEKRHMPLKSFLGDEPSPPRNTPAKEAGKEWNSPARYPTNIKREKRKGRSRGWVPFICCSSAQAS